MDRAPQAPAVAMETINRNKTRSRGSGQATKQRHVNKLSILALALLCTATAALADPVPAPPELINYVNEPAHLKVVLDVIRAQAARIPMCSPTKLRHSRLTAPGTVLFGASGQPSGGRWTETYTFDGCSQSGVFNVMTFIDKTGQIRTVGLLPGTTLASPGLQRDASEAAFIGAFLRAPAGCKPSQLQRIIDTAFAGFSGAPAVDVPPGRDPRPWRENWTVLVCNVEVTVPLHFTPDATGTKFTTGPR
jgi:hypothetical protein